MHGQLLVSSNRYCNVENSCNADRDKWVEGSDYVHTSFVRVVYNTASTTGQGGDTTGDLYVRVKGCMLSTK